MEKIFLTIMVLGFFLFGACNSSASEKKQEAAQSAEVNHSAMENPSMEAPKDDEQHAMITVQGNCEICKERIEKAAKAVNGVTSAMWEQQTKQLHLNFNPAQTSTDAISKAVAKVGHDTDKYKADKSTYDALPNCCKYR